MMNWKGLWTKAGRQSLEAWKDKRQILSQRLKGDVTLLKPWSPSSEIPAGHLSYRSVRKHMCCFKPFTMWWFVTKQKKKTSTLALRLLYHMYQKSEPWFQGKLRKGSASKHYWGERTRISAAAGGSESTSSSRLLERQVLWEEASFSDAFSISPSGIRPPSSWALPSPSRWTVWSADPSRWPPRPPCVCSRAAPSPGKGTSTRGTSFLCSSGRPARWALILPRSEQTPWHWGLVHSPGACTPRGHRPGPSCHHRWCPRSPGQGSPLSRRRDRPHPPGGVVCYLRREKWDNEALTWGMKWSSVLWDLHLSSRGRSPLRLQSPLVLTGSHCTGAAPESGFLQQW